MMTNMTSLITFGLSWSLGRGQRSTIGRQNVFNGGTISNEPFFLKYKLDFYSSCQHVRMFCFREGGDRMMVIFYNPTSIHLSRVGWVMRKSCGLGHRRY